MPERSQLRDTSLTPRVILMTGLAACVGVVVAGAAWLLLKLIAVMTNLFWYGAWSTSARVPRPHQLGLWAIGIPIVGGLLVGLIARYGSDRIRGHGTPETIEAVLVHGSTIAPRLAVLKPASAAIAIGSGGPFGAEGPIIATGGALGSLLAQLLTLSADERKVLLVSGAAGGMSAIFGTPVAAVLFALELLLYEYRPRSLIPVGIAAGVADVVRGPLLGHGALFSSPAIAHSSYRSDLGAVGLGLAAGLLAVGLTWFVSLCEHGFERLPIHWMWWPAIGGLAIGIGGELAPRALGVGYSSISGLLTGQLALTTAAALLAVKAVIWAVGLGSGTSGGVVAPVLLLGCCLGTLFDGALPGIGTGVAALIGMGALLAAMLRAPLTGVVFALELSQRPSTLLPLLLAVVPAYAVTALLVRRGILTERMDRRGNHMRTELDLDPLEVLLVRDVLPPSVVTLPAELAFGSAIDAVMRDRRVSAGDAGVQQRLYPVLAEGRLVGVLPRRVVVDHLLAGRPAEREGAPLATVMVRDPVVCSPDDPLRLAAATMAGNGVTRLPVLADGEVVGVLSLAAVLQARLRDLAEERDAERLIRIRIRMPGRRDRSELLLPAE